MPLPFNKSLDIKLINLVKDNEILYNPRHPKYLDFDTREVVWQKIGDQLSRPALVCKSRWVNIRDMMRRKIRDRLRSPAQRHYNYKYEEELTFMIPFFKDTTTHEEYGEFIDEESLLPSEVFVNECEFEREMKPNVIGSKKTNDCTISMLSGEAMSAELNPHDPLDVFLLTIGSTLRKLNPYFLNQAKSKIFQVVQDYELQQIVSKDDQPVNNSIG